MVNVLIVDDFATNGIFIKKLLEEGKYEVKTVISGRQALNYLDSGKKVDIILLDINMPEMDGIEVLKRIRQRSDYKYTPILFVTGNADRNKVLDGFINGIDDVIAKPVDGKFLNERVTRALRGETPVQQYKKRNSDDLAGLDSLYNNLVNEFNRGLGAVSGRISMDEGTAADSDDKTDNYVEEEKDEEADTPESYGLDFSSIIGQNLW